ncbi:hypothetical protein CEXT_683281 [Caerostris extrusa]|uniref:Uncharacterized protein n=1 Tax=Caerostris extrusa TaxID=172846 RepID=A0AAV4V8V6_CAEEX|nr:hypothetical protein CEXT_683281 [Caerostris extrusa]
MDPFYEKHLLPATMQSLTTCTLPIEYSNIKRPKREASAEPPADQPVIGSVGQFVTSKESLVSLRCQDVKGVAEDERALPF